MVPETVALHGQQLLAGGLLVAAGVKANGLRAVNRAAAPGAGGTRRHTPTRARIDMTKRIGRRGQRHHQEDGIESRSANGGLMSGNNCTVFAIMPYKPPGPCRRIRSGHSSARSHIRDRVGRLRQFLIASGQFQMTASTRTRRKIEQPEESGCSRSPAEASS